LGKGYSPNPYQDFLTQNERKRVAKSGIFPRQKIEIIKTLSTEAGLAVGDIFDEFYRGDLRNAISHSDFIFTDDGFRCRNGSNRTGAFQIPYSDLDLLFTKAKAFISAFFILEREARLAWGEMGGKRGLAYDPIYKGIMEVLVDDEGLMNGFKVHWPNMEESYYRRMPEGIQMTNCFLSAQRGGVEFFVGLYAAPHGSFSPLVAPDAEPRYTPIEGTGEIPIWNP
jgi:hypothetical protein